MSTRRQAGRRAGAQARGQEGSHGPPGGCAASARRVGLVLRNAIGYPDAASASRVGPLRASGFPPRAGE